MILFTRQPNQLELNVHTGSRPARADKLTIILELLHGYKQESILTPHKSQNGAIISYKPNIC